MSHKKDVSDSVPVPHPAQGTLENGLYCLRNIKQQIENCKINYEKLLKDQKDLSKANDELQKLSDGFRQHCETMTKDMEEETKHNSQNTDYLQRKLTGLQEEEQRLKDKVLRVQKEHGYIDEQGQKLVEEAQVSTTRPEKNVVFVGNIGNMSRGYDLTSRIVYPMEGGTALLTFEDQKVAEKILTMKRHVISLGDCSITLEVQPVQFIMPSCTEIDTYVCPRSILVSNLPDIDDDGRLLDRLDVYFSKTRHGGGEVENISVLQDSGCVVITFLNDNVAKGLVEKEYHAIEMGKKKVGVRVTPYLQGKLTNLQTKMSVSKCTVLLTGIPSVMDQDTMQDSLEIHFQKPTNGGGEVDAFAYNPVGGHMLAIFEDDSAKDQ